MQDDGSISLHLRLTTDGKAVNDTLVYKIGDHALAQVTMSFGISARS